MRESNYAWRRMQDGTIKCEHWMRTIERRIKEDQNEIDHVDDIIPESEIPCYMLAWHGIKHLVKIVGILVLCGLLFRLVMGYL